MSTESKEASGVQKLIDRLHHEGIEKGQVKADELVGAARQEAMDILDKAKEEAEAILSTARKEAERTREAGEEAVRMAGRDAILKLTEELRADFERKLRHLVDHSLKDTEFLRRLILEVGRKAVPPDDEGQRNILVLHDISSAQGEEPFEEDELNQFVRSLGGDALRDGLTFKLKDAETAGVRVQVVNDDLEIDLTTETLTHLLLQHVSPRFRTILGED